MQAPRPFPGCSCKVCSRDDLPDYKAIPPVFQRYRLMRADPDQGGQYQELTQQQYADFEAQYANKAEWLNPPNKTKWHSVCKKLLRAMMNADPQQTFNMPVRFAGYDQVIFHPMSYAVINQKGGFGYHKDLKDYVEDPSLEQYTDPNDFVNDMRLIYRNCAIFNAKARIYVELARSMGSTFEQKLQQYNQLSL